MEVKEVGLICGVSGKGGADVVGCYAKCRRDGRTCEGGSADGEDGGGDLFPERVVCRSGDGGVGWVGREGEGGRGRSEVGRKGWGLGCGQVGGA